MKLLIENWRKFLCEDSYDIETGATAMSHEEVIQDKIQMRLDKIALPEEREKVRKMIDQLRSGEGFVDVIGSLSEGAQYILHIIRVGLSRGEWD